MPRLGEDSGISGEVRYGVEIPVSIFLNNVLSYLSPPHHLLPVCYPQYNAQNRGNNFSVAASELGEATGHAPSLHRALNQILT